MKSKIFKWLSVVMITFSLISLSTVANANHCRWQNGHKVCWHHHHHCKWVKAHTHHGRYVPAHKVCWH